DLLILVVIDGKNSSGFAHTTRLLRKEHPCAQMHLAMFCLHKGHLSPYTVYYSYCNPKQGPAQEKFARGPVRVKKQRCFSARRRVCLCLTAKGHAHFFQRA